MRMARLVWRMCCRVMLPDGRLTCNSSSVALRGRQLWGLDRIHTSKSLPSGALVAPGKIP